MRTSLALVAALCSIAALVGQTGKRHQEPTEQVSALLVVTLTSVPPTSNS